jgi:hypothetical protein
MGDRRVVLTMLVGQLELGASLCDDDALADSLRSLAESLLEAATSGENPCVLMALPRQPQRDAGGLDAILPAPPLSPLDDREAAVRDRLSA